MFFSDDFISFVGRPIALSESMSQQELTNMQKVIKFDNKYLKNSKRSAHVCRRNYLTRETNSIIFGSL